MLAARGSPVRTHWLSRTLGPGFQPASFPATIPGVEVASIRQSEMPVRAAAVLDACPSWLDSSPLTFELAEEIWLREGRTPSIPSATRGLPYLFEHRLIQCLEAIPTHALVDGVALEVARRDGAIQVGARACLSASGRAVRRPVPSVHRRTDDRSLEAAQRRLFSAADPRTNRST